MEVEMVDFTSKELVSIPDVNQLPMPRVAETGVVANGVKVNGFDDLGKSHAYPDVRSFRRKFGLIIPATNTNTEHELWSIISKSDTNALAGIGFHTSNVVTPTPKLETEADLLSYKTQFLNGLDSAVQQAEQAQPEYLIMGMSLEHIISGIEGIQNVVEETQSLTSLNWATWHDAAQTALTKFKAMRIGLISPFDELGNRNAAKMFEDLGFEVVSSVGFSCAHAVHIAHIPDWAKEKAIFELLNPAKNKLDAIVQCGTNMSMLGVTDRLEQQIGIPILGINATTLWYALRENGITDPLLNCGRLFSEF